ncbi:MAG: site-2 protease family protein [Acidimicrobiaceae bacterium]|nr:site-2 protease family protein [Acidimicrobiaceae bacterium]
MTESRTSSLASVFSLLVGTVAVVGLLTWLWGWALPLVLFLVIAMVMGHEFGHFITAKRSGMKVTDFFVGFGPVLWSTTRGETRYGIRALLLGGYVKVPGMTWYEEIAPEEEKRTYRSASYPRKVIFASAGSLMHVVMALLIAYAALVFVGHADPQRVSVDGFTSWQGHSLNAAQIAGMKIGDEIISINGQKITGVNELTTLIHSNANHTIDVMVLRGGHDVMLHAIPVDGRTVLLNGKPEVTGTTPVGLLGIHLTNPTVYTNWLGAVPDSFRTVGSTISQAAHSLVHVFSPGEFSTLFHQVTTPSAAKSTVSQTTRPVSIVEVVRLADQAAQSNVPVFFTILITLNIFVGLMNMLPMLPLDGGYVAIATYERLRRRGTSPYKADINKLTPVVFAFVGVLLVLFASTLYLDIAYPIANPFH